MGFTVALAVNGLRNAWLRRHLLQHANLSWEQLKRKSCAAHLSRLSEDALNAINNECIDEQSIGRLTYSYQVNSSSKHWKKDKILHRSNHDKTTSINGDDSFSKKKEACNSYQHCSYKSQNAYKSYSRCFRCDRAGHYGRNCPKTCARNSGTLLKIVLITQDATTKRENRIRVMDSLKSVKFDKKSDGTYNHNVSPKITRTLLVSGRRIEFLLDTGSEVSTLTEATAEKLNIK